MQRYPTTTARPTPAAIVATAHDLVRRSGHRSFGLYIDRPNARRIAGVLAAAGASVIVDSDGGLIHVDPSGGR